MRAAAAGTYATNGLVALLSLLNVLVVARALGPAGRGDVALAITIASLAANAAALGVQEANANLGGSEPGRRPALASNSLLLAAAVGTLTCGLVAALAIVFPAVRGDLGLVGLAIGLVAVPLILARLYLSFLLQADYAFRVTNLAWLLGPVTSLSLNAALAAAGQLSSLSAISAWVLGQLLGVALLVGGVVSRFGLAGPDFALAGRALVFGIRAHVGRFMALANYRIDQWFLGALAGSRELGLYSIAVAWAELLFYVPGVLVIVQRPHIVRAAPRQAAELAGAVFRVGTLLAAVAGVGLIVAAPLLCVAVFGAEFAGSVDDLRVLALAAFGITAVELLGSALIAQRRPLLTTAAIAVGFVATLTLDLLLIPPLGGLGAALATAAAWSIAGLAVAVLFTRALPAGAGDLLPRGRELHELRAFLTRRPGGAARNPDEPGDSPPPQPPPSSPGVSATRSR